MTLIFQPTYLWYVSGCSEIFKIAAKEESTVISETGNIFKNKLLILAVNSPVPLVKSLSGQTLAKLQLIRGAMKRAGTVLIFFSVWGEVFVEFSASCGNLTLLVLNSTPWRGGVQFATRFQAVRYVGPALYSSLCPSPATYKLPPTETLKPEIALPVCVLRMISLSLTMHRNLRRIKQGKPRNRC